MKKDVALAKIEKAKYFYIDILISDNIPLSIKVNKKKLKNLVARFKSEDDINMYTMYMTKDFEASIFFVITINY